MLKLDRYLFSEFAQSTFAALVVLLIVSVGGVITDVLKDIADEERVHAGEFLRLLHELDPEEQDFYAEGAEEVEEEIEKMK